MPGSRRRGRDVLPLADLELRRANPNYRLVNDYSAWFFGELSEGTDEYTDEDGEFDDEEQSEGDDEEPEVPEEVTWRQRGVEQSLNSSLSPRPSARWSGRRWRSCRGQDGRRASAAGLGD